MKIRKADKVLDYEQIWDIFFQVIKTGDTYVFDPNTSKEALDKYWLADYMDTFVAVDDNDLVIGTYIIKPNQVDLGNHIANCSYMVKPNYQGKGIGKLMCEHSIEFAKQKGYFGIQFNIVVSTNTGAVNLWKKYGFEIIGTTPKGFRHKELGLVDTYIMFKKL
ncbi:GNAT family N-acetyltransferase [Pontibacter harenae]|uniref:GNAT family N-acetyltransferase n=1 Tax=Pontibacter harenae TaxID=2894083 RepID=UPI001E47FF05|nr:GNAT family N-acetyltransferase [Pontibacter harenae]MCC9166392.1 GNAT family N-acetyltransferase [Pontibacter harenae]